MGDATCSLADSLKTSLKNGSRALGELLDVDDVLKSVRNVSNPQDMNRKSSVVHEPIDWSKYPPSAFTKVMY